jgi:uncharacterized protein (DUF2267 family)
MRRALLAAGSILAGIAVVGVHPRVRRTLRRSGQRVRRRISYLRGRVRGLRYRMLARGPTPDVDDDVLEQRVRSTLGSLRRRYDLPPIEVSAVMDGSVVLDGYAPDLEQVRELEASLSEIPGVEMVISRIQVDDAVLRPSQRRDPAASPLRRELLAAVRQLDVGDEEQVERLVAATLVALFSLLPDDPARHLRSHVPADVQMLIAPPIPIASDRKPRTTYELVDEVSQLCGRSAGTSRQAIAAVFATLREMVPEEMDDVQAVLPAAIKPLWRGARPATIACDG